VLGSSQVGANNVHAKTTMDKDKDTDKRRQQHDNYNEDDKDEVGMKKES
jgi:hypothetical protein